MPERTVAASLARALTDFAAGRGAEADQLLSESGLQARELEDRDARIAFEQYIALTRAAVRATREPALPLYFGAEIDLSEVSIVGLIGQAAETMADALSQLNRYGKLVIDVDVGGDRFANEVRADGVWMVDRRVNPNDFPELTDTTFARMLCGVRRITPDLKAREIHVTHEALAAPAIYERVLGAPVTFGASWNAYRIDPAFITHPLRKQPRYAFGILTQHADALLRELDASKSARGHVESLLMPLLHTGDISVEAIAERLAMSRQTLYRRLKEEGATFESVLDDLRRRMALDYLETIKTSINETAYLVGFSEPAAFSRAFKRWTGSSPRDYLAARRA